jgi:hypothetical protein
VQFLQLVFDRSTQAIAQERVGAQRVGHYLDYVLAREAVGDMLVESVGHRQNVHSIYLGTADFSGSGE